MKYKIFSLFLIVLVISCKKKVDDPAPANPAPSNNNSNSYYGLLRTGELTFISPTFTSNGISVSADFSSNPMIGSGTTGNRLDAGSIFLNSTLLKKDGLPSSIYYYDTTGTSFTLPLTWSVSGGPSVPTFSQSITGPYPVYTGTAAVQNTITLSQGATIPLNGISGADEIEVLLLGSSSAISKTVSITSASAIFSASELTSIGTSTAGYLMITVSKNTIASFGGKNYKFQVSQQLTRSDMVFN